jgi:hypothetical protein
MLKDKIEKNILKLKEKVLEILRARVKNTMTFHYLFLQ